MGMLFAGPPPQAVAIGTYGHCLLATAHGHWAGVGVTYGLNNVMLCEATEILPSTSKPKLEFKIRFSLPLAEPFSVPILRKWLTCTMLILCTKADNK